MEGRGMDGTEAKNLIEDKSLAEIVQRLVKAYCPERIYLFGSRSRSDSGVHSDYDLIVVVPDSVPPERKRSRLAYEVLRGTGIAADVLVWTNKAFNCRLHLRASLPYTIISEGKLLYAA
jgi:predicted nucleotidyltransferase